MNAAWCWRALRGSLETHLPSARLARRELATLAHPYNGEDLVWHKVAPSMGKLTMQGPECSAELRQHDIASFFQRKPAGKGARAHENGVLGALSLAGLTGLHSAVSEFACRR